jgi:RHS repeat-associated protein
MLKKTNLYFAIQKQQVSNFITDTVSIFTPNSEYYNCSVTTDFVFGENGRLYDPVICRFFSPDNFVQAPEFTQGFNRYSYALNNPLKYVDPTGQRIKDVDDIWDFDREGNFLKRTEDKNFDQIRVLNDDGTVFAETDKFEYGTIKAHNRPTVNVEGIPTLLDIFNVKGDDNATQIFETFANSTSTEWTHAKIGLENSGNNMVGTSHSTESTAIGSYLRETGYRLRSVTHNHPSNNPMPSGVKTFEATGMRTKDLRGAELYLNKNPNTQLYIYTTKYGYSPYNQHGSLDTRIVLQNGKWVIMP